MFKIKNLHIIVISLFFISLITINCSKEENIPQSKTKPKTNFKSKYIPKSINLKPPQIEKADSVIVSSFLKHARFGVLKLSIEKLREIKTTESHCWITFPTLKMSLVAYQLTRDTTYLDEFVVGFEKLRSLLIKGPDGFLGWRGLPLKSSINPDNPNVQIDEIQTSGRATAIIAQFIDLCLNSPLAHKYEEKCVEYRNLMKNHLIKKWHARGSFTDLEKRGGIYHWNKNYISSRNHVTLAHEKTAILLDGILKLYKIDRDDETMKIAVMLGIHFKRCLELVDDRYTWNSRDVEGVWDVDPKDKSKWKIKWIAPDPMGSWYSANVNSALQLYHYGLVFNSNDVKRFLKTQMTVCWNGEFAKPVFKRTDGKDPQRKGDVFLASSLAPFDVSLEKNAFYNKGWTNRRRAVHSSWRGGVLASNWLEGKYIYLPLAKKGQMYKSIGDEFRKRNTEFLKNLEFEVIGRGYITPKTPAEALFLNRT